MWKLAVIALVVAALARSADATPRHWYTDKKWWVGEAVIVGSTMADAASTCRGVGRGGVEQNMILGPSPSCGHVFAFEVGATGYWTFFHALDWHLMNGENPDAKLGWRVFGYTVIPIAAFAVNGSAAIQNFGVPNPAPSNTKVGTAFRIRGQAEIRSEFNRRVGEGFVK